MISTNKLKWLLCLWLLTYPSLWAQRPANKGKKKAIKTEKVSAPSPTTEELLLLCRKAYQLGDFDSAAKNLEEYQQIINKKNETPSPEAEVLSAHLSRSIQYLDKVEEVQFTDSIECSLTEISDKLSDLTTGRIQLRYLDQQKLYTAFETSLKRQRIENKLNQGQLDLIRMYLVGKNWEVDNEALIPLNSSQDEVFPYLLSDGITLLFARDNENSTDGFGGFDLYFSRLNWERNIFYEPSLLGFPFNSPANDYLLVYDEEQGKGYLVSDRGINTQGNVRIYQFEGLPKALGKSVAIESQPEI